MDKNLFQRFPGEGLIKTADEPISGVEADRKVKLNRRGNELFNKGDIETARRIFQTTGYSDGLIRVGDRYLGKGRAVDALKMYWLAKDSRKTKAMIDSIVIVIEKLLREEEEET